MQQRTLSLVAALASMASIASLACATAPERVGGDRGAGPHAETAALKERVARLERRLADADAKLGLLLAQRGGGPQLRRASPAIPDVSLTPAVPREEASLGASTIDIPRGASVVPSEIVEDESATEVEDSEQREPVVLRMRQSEEPSSERSIEDGYSWAQGRLKEGRHAEALSMLEDLLVRAPRHRLADNCLYWIGWAHAERGDARLALDAWENLPMRFPRSDKIPDALFGMAMAHEALGEPALAETLYDQLLAQYPRADKAREAKKALGRLRPR